MDLTIYGAVGYQVVEGWSLLDALYMTVITLATVGFHEVQPLDAKGPGLYHLAHLGRGHRRERTHAV